LITSWLSECKSNHSNCPSNTDVALPTRLIDVGHNGATPRLVLTEGGRGEYLTLSYCWGSTNQSTTTLANLNDRLNVLPLNSFCQTHRDAIEITRRLGFQYLWIDAICIVQDDLADWNRQSAKMFNIYRDSVLTIAASWARDADEGIFAWRPTNVLANTAMVLGLRYSDDANKLTSQIEPEDEIEQDEQDLAYPANRICLPIGPDLEDDAQPQTEGQSPRFLEVQILVERVSEGTDDSNAITDTAALIAHVNKYPFMLLRKPVLSHKIYSYGFHQEHDATQFPLEDRAWCFQERILATRIVHFSRDELVWECRGATLCECGAMRTEGGTTTRRQFEVNLQASSSRARSDSWMELVKKCTSRKVGRQSDRLPTLSGLAKTVQHDYGYEDYLAGLWKEFLPAQLLWSTMCGYKAQRAREYRAPTWSFASVENAEYFKNALETIFETDRESLVQIVNVECLPATVDPTGIAASGHITITGPVRQGMLEVQQGRDHYDKNYVGFVVSVGGKSHQMTPDYRILEPADDTKQRPSRAARTEQTSVMASTDQFTPDENKHKHKQGDNTVEVTLLAIYNEHRGQTRIGGKGPDTLFCLVLKARDGDKANMEATGVTYERIGLMELDQPDEPKQWLGNARTETVTIL
jgi:hypothetical protein